MGSAVSWQAAEHVDRRTEWRVRGGASTLDQVEWLALLCR